MDTLCHIVPENKTNPESDFDIRPHCFPKVISVPDFGDESKQLRMGEVRCNFILSKFCNIQADQLLARTSAKSGHVYQSAELNEHVLFA